MALPVPRLRLLLLASLLLPAPALPAPAAPAAPAAPLRVVMDANYPPFAHRNADGKLEGYTVDLWRLWQQKTGVAVEMISANWGEVQPMLQRRDADVIDPIFRTADRAARIDFSEPYATVATAIYADASLGAIHEMASLKGFEVAVQADDACAEQLRLAGVRKVRVFPSHDALVAAAASQSIKLLCMDEYSADYHLYRLGLQRSYVKAFEVARDQLRRGVRKGDVATLTLVERGMAQIRQAERDALHERWMGRPLVFTRYAERLVQALVVLACLVLLLGVWLVTVRRAVSKRTAELDREQAQLRTLVQNSPDLVWLKDRHGVYQACNAKAASLFGKPPAEIVGRRDEDLFEPTMALRYQLDDAAALRAGRAVTFEEIEALPGAAGTRVFETIKTPVTQADGSVIGVLGVARDITERRLQEQTIREQERLLAEMSTLAHVGAWEIDLATGVFHWTAELARIYELPPGQPLTPEACTQCYAPDDRALIERSLEAARLRAEPFDIELEMVNGGGRRKWVRSLCRAELEDGRVVKLCGTMQDVTQRRDLEESMRMANLIYQTSLEAIVVTDEANQIVDANPAFTTQTGYALPEVLGTRPALFASRMHDDCFYQRLWQELEANDHWEGEILDRNSDGSFTAKYVNMRAIRHPDGRIYRHVIQFRDISEQKEKDELIWRQTNFDALTGLPNRRLFVDRLEQELKKAHGAESGQGLGVLLLDLDRFKEVNDSFGHAKGDAALVELTRRIERCAPEGTTVGRLGSNMFALIVSEFDGRTHLETTAEALIGAIAAPLALGTGDATHVSASVGISVYPDDGTNATDLVRNAEAAVYLAKSEGRGRFQYFTPTLQKRARSKLTLTNDLRAALARGQLQAHYQPIVDLSGGPIRKAEVLLRWEHPERGMISPATFIPLAEEAGLIDEIGEWVVIEAIASIERWRRAYGYVVELSVNVSPVQFDKRSGLPWLERVVNSGLPPNSLTIEITEGLLVSDAQQVKRCLDRLHRAGARVSIDDFGTGFSSLSYLKDFEVDYLKIDKSFINNLTDNGADKALTEGIIDLAHRLGIEAIAEGVESAAQRDMLAAFGCDYIQGYYCSAAMTREAFEAALERQMVH
ncbi:EAL domain-containing protein [Massilia niabensis]|uniref:EAL domain-containing protein n=1 Tax=Massilia niabensis TaxID=544910 RepID=A0ABW0LA89_9BURK